MGDAILAVVYRYSRTSVLTLLACCFLYNKWLLFKLCGDSVGYGLHFFGGGGVFFGEIHVGFAVDGEEVYMGVGHFKAYNGHSYPRAGDGFLDCFGYATGEEGEVAVFVFGEIEDVVDFTTGDDEDVAAGYGVDVEKGVVLVIGGDFVGGDFAGSYFGEDSHRELLFEQRL